MIRSALSLTALLGLPLVGGPARASDLDSESFLSEQAFLQEMPTVLSVTRLRQSMLDTPAAVTVIDREMIEASGARTVAELFRLVPGMQVGYDNGNRPSVTYHGMSDQFSRGMQVLVDGRSIYSPSLGGVNWSDQPLTLDDIQRIEVIRGPDAATYGANSFLGVISISTFHPAEVGGATLRVRRGNQGVRDVVARYAGGQGRLDLRASLAYREDDGFPRRDDFMRARVAVLRADVALSDTDTLSLKAGYNDGPREEGFAGDDVQPLGSRQIEARYQQLRWRHVLGPDSETVVQLYHNYRFKDETLGGGFFPPADADLEEDRYDLELQHTTGEPGSWRLVWGAGARRDEVRSRLFFGTGRSLSNRVYRLFGNLEWQLAPRVTLNLGAMGEHNDLTGSDLSPRLAVNYRLAPLHSVRVVYSKALRTPSLAEDQIDLSVSTGQPGVALDIFRGTGELQPESLISRELGYVGRFPAWGLDLDLRVFNDSFFRLGDLTDQPTTNPLNLVLDIDLQATTNDLSATVRGWEMHLDWRPRPEARLVLNYSRAWAIGENPRDKDNDKLQLSVPFHTLSALAIYRLPARWTASAAYYWLSEHQWLGEGDRIPHQHRLDLRLAKDLRIGAARVRVAAIGQGVTGKYPDFRRSDTDPERRNEVDTRYYLTVRLDL